MNSLIEAGAFKNNLHIFKDWPKDILLTSLALLRIGISDI